MMIHTPYSENQKWTAYKGKDIPTGTGYWETEIRQDNMPSCKEDCAKQHRAQEKWGFRFFDGKPVETFKI
jgi:hypothetical protein